MKKPFAIILLFWLGFVALPSFPKFRSILAAPLIVTNEGAGGDACYVLSAGNAIWERLAAASDLYHMRRVPKIILMRNSQTGPYNFTAQASWDQTQWALEYLVWRGVPKQNVLFVAEVKGIFGTLSEAKNIANNLPSGVKQLVLVTSPPHTRRSLLAFKSVMPASIKIIPFAATSFATSAEMSDPIWLEYFKLLVYKLHSLL